MIVQRMKDFIDSNIYISELVKSMVGYSYNKNMTSFIKCISSIDSILDVDDFEEVLKEIPSTLMGSYHTLKHSYGENTLYGYATNVLKYANLQPRDIFYLPYMEHGISVENFFQSNMKHPVIFQGRYKESFWRENSRTPIYFIGPYIHYAEDYYDETEVAHLRKKWGKTLLIFPPHSTEKDELKCEFKSFTNYLFNKIGRKYDTIIACVYWANFKDKYFDYLKACGVRIVSAGFKLDNFFVNRLKTIINLSDTVLFPFFTTSIGFAYYLGKKVICVDNTRDINYVLSKGLRKEEGQILIDGFNSMHRCFSYIFSETAEPFSKTQYELVNKYWGISEIKTPDEIRNIFNGNKKRILSRVGF